MRKIFLLFFLASFSSIHSQVELQTTNEEDEVLITIIEDVPIYPGCEDVEKSKRIECFNSKITELISTNFKYPILAEKFKVEGKVLIQFTIDKLGEVIDIKTSGHQLLTDEAERLINLLPKMTPGTQRGKKVKVKYSIPLTFKLPN